MNTDINAASAVARVRTSPVVGARMGGISVSVTELRH